MEWIPGCAAPATTSGIYLESPFALWLSKCQELVVSSSGGDSVEEWEAIGGISICLNPSLSCGDGLQHGIKDLYPFRVTVFYESPPRGEMTESGWLPWVDGILIQRRKEVSVFEQSKLFFVCTMGSTEAAHLSPLCWIRKNHVLLCLSHTN